MTDKTKIGLIGGDERFVRVAERLSERYECAVFGLSSVPRDAVRCTSWESAVRASDAVILPLPVTRDGKTLDAGGVTVSLDSLAEAMRCGATVFGGMIPSDFRALLAEHGCTAVDYYDSESVQIRNAVLTAEGTIAAIIGEMRTSVYGMSITVTGYGRVARALCGRLVSLGAAVYTVARHNDALAWAETEGCIPVPLGEYLHCPHDSDAIVNTVPALLFGDDVLASLDPATVYFELAGNGGGIDPQTAEKYGIKVVPLPSLPGKTAPDTAGDIIANEILLRLGDTGGDEK